MFMFAFCLQYVYGEQLFTFWCDAADYFNRGKIIYEASFDISSIDGFRGVVFPFILACVHALGGKIFFYLLSPLFFCFFTCICVSLLKNYFYLMELLLFYLLGYGCSRLQICGPVFSYLSRFLFQKFQFIVKKISFFYVHYFLECSYIFPII